MKYLIILFLLLANSLVVSAQSNDEGQKTAMEKFSWLEGTWEGIAWTKMGPQKRDTFWIKEVISYDLDRSILDIEGMHGEFLAEYSVSMNLN